MKMMKKVLSVVLALSVVMAFSITSFAADNGTITISNPTVDKTYTLYKVFDATVGENGEIAYTYDKKLPNNDYFVQDEKTGAITATDKAKNGEELVSAAVKFLDDIKGAAVTSDTAKSTKPLVFSGLEYGYYYVETNNGAAVSVTSTKPTATVEDKNRTVSYDKNIVEGENLVKENGVNVGDNVTFQFDLTAKNHEGNDYITNYLVYDKMDAAFDFNNDIKVFVNDNEVTGWQNLTPANSEYDFVISIPWTANDGKFLYEDGAKIKVVYSGRVNENVKVTEGMTNDATYDVVHKNVPSAPSFDKDIPTPENPWKKTYSFSSKVIIEKVDENGNALTGAKFSVSGQSSVISLINKQIFKEQANGGYWMLKDGKYTNDAPQKKDEMKAIDKSSTKGYVVAEEGYAEADAITIDGTTYREVKTNGTDADKNKFELLEKNTDLYDNPDKQYALIEVIETNTDLSNISQEGYVASKTDDATGEVKGQLSFTGLGEGEYKFKELVAPNGYNLLDGDFVVNMVFVPGKNPGEGAYQVKSVEYKGTELDQNMYSFANNTLSFKVENTPGTVLPSTGGIGTTIFYVLGIILVLGATILLITRRRMDAR